MDKRLKSVQEFWNRCPCNIKHSRRLVGSKEYFNEVEKKRYFVEPHNYTFPEFYKWKGKSVLEIGCGIGTDAINFARHGAKLTAIEISQNSLNLSKTRFRVFGLSAELLHGNAEFLSSFVPVKPYDLIYSFGVIHHTPNPKNMLEEIKKYCDKDTEIKIMLYAKWSWKALEIIIKYGKLQFWKVEKLVQKYSEAQTGSPFTYCYSKSEIVKLMDGYKIISIEKTHIFPYRVDKYLNQKYDKTWYFKYMPSFLFTMLKRLFGRHLLITAKIKESF